MQTIEQVLLYSDGGAELGRDAAGASIVENPASGRCLSLAVFLGRATNNEAEITAGLLGFSFLALLSLKQRRVKSVRWVCDSEYVLLSATQYIREWQRNGWRTAAKKPVKNQGLWGAYLKLSSGIAIIPEHVSGHSGHPENEACDGATQWVRKNGGEILDEQGPGARVEIGGAEWFLFDGREFIERLRKAKGAAVSAGDCLLLRVQLEKAGLGRKIRNGGTKC